MIETLKWLAYIAINCAMIAWAAKPETETQFSRRLAASGAVKKV